MWLTVILYFLSILIPGWLILTLWFDTESRGGFKKIALSYGLGTMLLTTEIFLLVFVLRLPIKWLHYILGVEIVLGILLYLRRFGFDFIKRFKTEKKKISWIEGFLAFLIFCQFVLVNIFAWLKPVINWDSVAMWSFKAKILFYNLSGFFNPNNQDFWQNQNQSGYPWLVPLSQYWLAVLNKSFDEVLVNFIFVGFFVSIIFLLYGYLRNYINRTSSLLFVWLFSTMPLIVTHAHNAYADLPLAFYLGTAFILTYKWLDTKNHKYLILSWLFLASALLTKNEAIIFVIAHLLILLFAKRGSGLGWKKILLSALPALIIIAPWLGFKLVNKLSMNNVGGGLGWHPEIIGQLLSDLFAAASWNVWWYIFFGLSLLFIRQIIKDRSLRLVFGLWFLAMGGLLILYVFTEEYQFAVDGTALSRNLINFVPSSVFLTGLLLRREFFTSNKFFGD
jgi:uncharacterized protein with PQ loop repeat